MDRIRCLGRWQICLFEVNHSPLIKTQLMCICILFLCVFQRRRWFGTQIRSIGNFLTYEGISGYAGANLTSSAGGECARTKAERTQNFHCELLLLAALLSNTFK